MLHLVGFDAQLHAIFVKGLLSKLDILGFDLGRLASASGPTQSLVMRHQLLNGCSVFRHQSVAAVKSGKEGGGKKLFGFSYAEEKEIVTDVESEPPLIRENRLPRIE